VRACTDDAIENGHPTLTPREREICDPGRYRLAELTDERARDHNHAHGFRWCARWRPLPQPKERAGARLGLPDPLAGAVEDAASLGLGKLLTR